ncbi:MAG: glycosyltransferase [Bacteroides sp.]|nr:glycosyltransferase [Bacteroides sp.]
MNKRKPLFSIITVTWNAQDTLERTLQSVASQRYGSIEYIVIDGESRDNTLNLTEKYQSSINKLISEPDQGIYDAMNKGIRQATGDYLCFLNAGDTFYTPLTLQEIVDTLPATGDLPDIIYGETAIVDKEGAFLYMRRLSAPEHLTWKSFKSGMRVCHQAFLVKRSLAEPYDLRYRLSADFDWCIRMMKKTNRICNTHLILINYLNEGMTTRNHKASLKERFRIMVHYYGLISTLFYHCWFVIRLILKPEK